MKASISILLLMLIGFVVKAQLPSSTFPSRVFNGNTKAQWILLDSPVVNPILDTFNARYPGTQLVRIQGGDTAFWFGAGGHLWFRGLLNRDTISLSNRINLKLNISDTTSKWWGIGKRWVDTVYRKNDSTIGFTINNGSEQTFQILGRSSGGGGGVGTVTSVGLSMPSAFTVTNSPITTNGTISVSGAGTSAQYIRGNGTLATFDTAAIPNFYLKVRGLLSGTSPLSYNSTTGILGIADANNTGQKGAATFNNSDFIDNGAGLISLRNPSAFPGVDSIWRVPSIDSIYFTINSTQYAIKDSTNPVIANNGLSLNTDSMQLGQEVGAIGDPAALHHSTEIPLNSLGITFTGTGSVNIGTTSMSSLNKLNIVGTGFEKGININVTSASAINAVATGTSTTIFGQNQGTGSGVQGSVTGTAGYGILGTSSANGGVPMRASVFNTANNSAAPVVLELERNASGGTSSDGIGATVMFKSQTTTTTGVEAGQLRSYFSTALHSSRTSAFELYLVNNTVSARKALLSGNGQWTWDGYPSLTAQTDTNTYKPIAIDGSGNVVKMIGWSGTGGGGSTPTWNAVMTVGNIAFNTNAYLSRSDGGATILRLNQNDTGNTNAIASVDVEALGAKAVLRLQTCWQHEDEVQWFWKFTSSPLNHIVIDSQKMWTAGLVSILDANQNYIKGFRITAPYFGNMIPLAIDSNGSIGLLNVVKPKGVLHIPGAGAGGIAPLFIDPSITPVDANSGRIRNDGTSLLYTDNAGTEWYLNNEFGRLPSGTFPNPSLAFSANSAAGMGYNGIIGTPVMYSNSGGNDVLSFVNSNSSGNGGFSIRDNSFNQRAVVWLSNANSRWRLAAGSGISIDFEPGGFNDNDPYVRFTSAGRVYIKGLDTDNSPPSTSGTTKMVITDANAQLSFTDIPTSTTIYTGDGTVSGNRVVNVNNNNLTFSDANIYKVSADFIYQTKADGSRSYASAIDPSSLGAQAWQFAYSPFTRGIGLYVDTLNNVGLGDNVETTAPLYTAGNSTTIAWGLQSENANYFKVSNIITNTTLNNLNYNFVTVDATSGNITITLPAASASFGDQVGLELIFKRLDNSGNSITISRAGSDTIDGATSFTLTTQYESKRIRAISTSAWAIY